MPLAVTHKSSGAPCRLIDNDLCSIASIAFSYTFNLTEEPGEADQTWTGSGSATTNTVAFERDYDGAGIVITADALDDNEFAISRGACGCCRQAKIEIPGVNDLGQGTCTNTYIFETDPPSVTNGTTLLSISAVANPSNADQYDLVLNATTNDAGPVGGWELEITVNAITLEELLGTHSITLDIPPGFNGTATATWTIS